MKLFDDSTDFKIEPRDSSDEETRLLKLSGFSDHVKSTLASDSKFDKRIIRF